MHVELTSRCTLSCPGCPRTWFSEKFNRSFPKQDLDLEEFIKFLDCDAGRKIERFLLSGNHGDPIYYPKLFEFIDHFRSTKYFRISTGGGLQTKKFWENLAKRLTDRDTFYFSIDGLEHDNHLYRRNSEWASIIEAVDIMRTQSSAKIVWKSLIFSYNQNEIEQMRELAESKGLTFIASKTARFGDESLKPDESFVDTSRLYAANKDVDLIEPMCLEKRYISADGYCWPCCNISTYYTLHSTALWKNRKDYQISGKTLDDLLVTLTDWKTTILDDMSNAHPVCKMQCKPGQFIDWQEI